MKFLCDNCKAKYQIADDKVAGKTVRMKCRKCGHTIEVKAAVTETSVAKSVPPPGPGEDDKTAVGPPPAALQQALRAAAPAKLATQLTSARPVHAAPKEKESALAGAFQKTVTRDETSTSRSMREIHAADQWYVAINGVPVGPIRLSELRRKAAVGAVTEESLVWQEGLEEWRALRTYPELGEAVREAIAGGRPSLTPAPDRPSRPIAPVSAPVAARPQPAPVRSAGAYTPPPATARSNVVPITSRLATAERLDEAPDPFAIAPQTAPNPEPVFSAPLGAVSGIGVAPPPVLAIEPKRPFPWIPIAMLVLAAGFGVTAAYAIFFRAPVAPAPTIIVSAAPPTTAAPTTTNTTVAAVDNTAAPPDSAGTSPIAHTGGPRPTAPVSAAPTKTVDPAIAALLQGTPATGPTVGSGSSGSGSGSLTSDQIEAVVRNHQTGIKRTCWERSGSTVSAVNVTAHITIGPTGSVQSSSAEGNDPIVTKCIENQVKTWQFPPTGSTSNVNIPFHFLRQ